MDTQTKIVLARVVADTAASAGTTDAINAFYRDIDHRVELVGPICERSGRCCHFEQYGHRLYVTTAELAAFIASARQYPAVRRLARQTDGDGCRFQTGKLCAAHPLRPMGCRMFYCDARTREPLQRSFEEMHAALKRLHEELDVPYHYVEWRWALEIIAPLICCPGVDATRPGGCPTTRHADEV